MDQISFADAYEHARLSPGVILFTVCTVEGNGTLLRRVFSTHESVYPVGAGEQLDGISPWDVQIVERGRPFVAIDAASLAEHMADDLPLIQTLGGGSCINVPVRRAGATIGVVSLVGEEGAYDASSVEEATQLAARLIDVLEEALAAG